MPETEQVLNVNTGQQTPSSTPPGGTPTPETSPAVKPPEPWRAPDTAPTWARGKTAEEILQITQRLVETFPSGVAQTQPVVQDVQQPTVQLSDDDYVTGKDVKAMLAHIAASQVTPALSQSAELSASVALGLTRQQYAKDFQRYGPEITLKLAGVPKHLWTLDNLETVVKLVRADHIDDISRERALEIVNTMEPTIRSTGVVGSVSVPSKEASLESDRIPAEWKERAMRVGITEETVREFCAANNTNVEAFYKQFETPRNPIAKEIKVGKETSG